MKYLETKIFPYDYNNYCFSKSVLPGLVENPEISFWYSATEDYGMANLTAAGWLDFVYRFDYNIFV